MSENESTLNAEIEQAFRQLTPEERVLVTGGRPDAREEGQRRMDKAAGVAELDLPYSAGPSVSARHITAKLIADLVLVQSEESVA